MMPRHSSMSRHSSRPLTSRLLRRVLIGAAALFLLLSLRTAAPVQVHAASSYKSLAEKIPSDSGSEVIKKIGSFWFKNHGGYLYYAAGKNDSYTYAGNVSGSYTDGSTILMVNYDTGYLQKINCRTGKTKKLKKLPGFARTGEGDSWSISAIYKNRVYLTRGSFNKWKYWTYLYRLDKKTFKKVRTNCAVCASWGKYFVADRDYRSDVSSTQLDLYKSTASGLKKIKTLAKHAHGGTVIGKKIYYMAYPKADMKKGVLYRCSVNGTGRKKLGEFKVTSEYGQVLAHDFTEKDCIVFIAPDSYRYNYATKKMTKIYY